MPEITAEEILTEAAARVLPGEEEETQAETAEVVVWVEEAVAEEVAQAEAEEIRQEADVNE